MKYFQDQNGNDPRFTDIMQWWKRVFSIVPSVCVFGTEDRSGWSFSWNESISLPVLKNEKEKEIKKNTRKEKSKSKVLVNVEF